MSEITTQETTMGAWSEFTSEISEMAELSFKEAFNGFVGVDYKPVAVAEQVIAGMNYQFFCNSKTVYPGATNEPAMVYITKPVGEQAVITQIIRISN
ncbi:hypothetical protein [Vibrio quintilis]|uniref:Uncharacterized protein n=1 Tax=Vibrio quintilis TaxID=1117707 RepID=A0A1M7YVK7_9VIBR|nr:hypothetical protein [Vibrio quintilis]SHO56652.1 hypothetical protein VQ7734_02421 [Vibrio quintilis]